MRKWALLLAAIGLAVVLTAYWLLAVKPDAQLARGQAALHAGDPDTARAIASRLEKAGYPDHAHLLRGTVFLHLATQGGQSAELSTEGRKLADLAFREFNAIADRGAIRLAAAALTGECLLLLKDFREAERAFRFVLAEQPDHVDAHRGLAALCYDLGAVGEAAGHLQEVARLAPADGRPHRLLGLIHKDLDHPKEAVTEYQEALQRKLSNDVVQEVRIELAEVLVRLSRYEEALEQIEGHMPAPGDVGKAIALRAECLWGLGRTDEARHVLDEAIKLHLRAPEILRLRGKLSLEAGKPKEAIQLLQEAVLLDRHDHASRYQLALALEQEGRKKEAAEQRQLVEKTRQLLTELTQLTEEGMKKPDDAEVRRRLASVCEQLDRHDLAALWRQAAAAVQPVTP